MFILLLGEGVSDVLITLYPRLFGLLSSVWQEFVHVSKFRQRIFNCL